MRCRACSRNVCKMHKPLQAGGMVRGSRGVVILDSNVFDHLNDKNFRSSIGRGMARHNLVIIPTDANVFEAMQSLNVKGRTFALGLISDMTERGLRRPKIPTFLLHDTGAA